ncbi:MAG: aquaporin [Deltaproteobacteria bacterium]|jgi:MIP family channel proteins|nr:aquaporin [Deltaproteobacteria bacterium]
MLKRFLGELGGTFVMVFLGVGAVQAAVLTGAQVGLWQVAAVWGVGVALAIYAFGSASGAHLNPAITLAMAAFRGFPTRLVPLYLGGQIIGAVAAAALLYLQFKGALIHFEAAQGIVRGAPGSELAAMAFGEYFPHPSLQNALGWAPSVVSLPKAMLAEFIGTGLLAAMVFALTDPHNEGSPGPYLTPAYIGLTVAAIISVLAPMTQAGLNPVRDFGPRLVAYAIGYGSVAIPGPSGGFFTVYILAPCLGALVGAKLYLLATGYGREAVPADLRASGQKAAQAAPRVASARAESGNHEENARVTKPKLIIVGGFLGAGKTTLLASARTLLEEKNLQTGLITNDQAPGLVDTAWLGGGDPVMEVAGSCFCCNFPAFEKSVAALTAWGAKVVLAEPVGSCTDLSATIVQPLKDLHADDYACAPFTVLLDPDRARELLGLKATALHPDAFYILGRQLDEADFIVLNKVDLLEASEKATLLAGLVAAWPGARIESMSARAGWGVPEWLEAVMAGETSGERLAVVDYDRYANGEAVLGWLNLTADSKFEGRGGAGLLAVFLERLRTRLLADRLQIGHVKVLWPSPEGLLVGNLTDVTKAPVVTTSAATVAPGPIVVNARVECEPEVLEALVREILAAVGQENDLSVNVIEAHSLKPGRPKPSYRYDKIVVPFV